MKRLALVLVAAAACGCARKDPPAAHEAFLPFVARGARGPWAVRVTLRNPGDEATSVSVHRWPPDAPASETEEITLGPRSGATVPARIPAHPSFSSYTIRSARPFEAAAQLVRPGAAGPALALPALPMDALARPGDTLVVGPFVKTEGERTAFCITFPWTERDAVPYRAELVIRDTDGNVLQRAVQALRGVPVLVEDPWRTYRLPPRAYVFEVKLLGGLRGRDPVRGIWAMGIAQDARTLVSRIIPTRVVRRGG